MFKIIYTKPFFEAILKALITRKVEIIRLIFACFGYFRDVKGMAPLVTISLGDFRLE